MNIKTTAALATLTLSLALTGIGAAPARADFGLTENGGSYAVDSGAGLVFRVNRANGDITSLLYKGIEVQGQTKMSHIGSGLGAAQVSARNVGDDAIEISAQTPTLTHYYLAHRGENVIYMATYISQEPKVGELRWITRLNAAKVPDGPVASDLDGNTGAIESKDIFGMANGQTRSKYYDKARAIDLKIRGASGPGVGVWMDYGSRESSSGGPFFRDIQNQQGGDQEVYNYMNSGHNQTEAPRVGVLNGPYALIFTDGKLPQTPVDYSWIGRADLDLKGWIAARGAVRGVATGISPEFQGVVGFANANSQGWATIDPQTGAFASPQLTPGDYTMTLYKGELAVAAQPVTIVAGAEPSVVSIASTEPNPPQIWRIGEWDGTPMGFYNAENITLMHPSDVREKPWAPTNFTIGQSQNSDFPAEQWQDINSPTTIRFTLAPAQIAPLTLRVGITAAYAGGRPQIAVNNWTARPQAASSQPKSRSLTLGTYRGNNTIYRFDIPASALIEGENTLSISVIGQGPFKGFLSPGYAYDCVELDRGAP